MAGNKIRTFLELIKKGETLEAAIAASEVSPSTAKIQLRKSGLTVKGAVPKASKVKSKPAKVKKPKPVDDEDAEDKDEDVDLDDIA